MLRELEMTQQMLLIRIAYRLWRRSVRSCRPRTMEQKDADLSYGEFRRWLKTFLSEQWGHSVNCINCAV